MIRQYNIEQVNNIITEATSKTRLLFALQLLSALCALSFVGWQAITDVKIYNLFFTVAWVLLEVSVLLWESRLKVEGLGRFKGVSFEAKQAIVGLIQDYSALRYVKFLGVLCNFFGLVGAIKSMRFYGAVEWSVGLCLLSLGLCLLWLHDMNQILLRLKSNWYFR